MGIALSPPVISTKKATTIAADPKCMGAQVGMTSVLHTWGSALTYHPHLHMIVPGGGLSPDGARWVACRPGFFLHVRVLSRLFRRLFLEGLMDLHRAGQLTFFGDLASLSEAKAFATWLAPFCKSEWVVYAKPPFGGPEAVLADLSRYTHRVAISNARLVSADAQTVAFHWKDYRIKSGDRQKVMRLATPEFIRRFLIQALPDGFHRIRHDGLLASATRRANITKICALLCVQCPGKGHRVGTRSRHHPIHPARTMPLLLWPHARHRDLRPRAKTNVARAATGAGRMTHRLSDARQRQRLRPADPVTTGCAHVHSAQRTAAVTPEQSAMFGASNSFAPVSGTTHTISRATDTGGAPTSAHFPHRSIQDPRGFLLGRFSKEGRGRTNAQRSAATRTRTPSPEPPLEAEVCAAVRLHQTGRSCTAQHFHGVDDRSAGLSCLLLRQLGRGCACRGTASGAVTRRLSAVAQA